MQNYVKGTYSKSIYETDNGYHVAIFKVTDTNMEEIKKHIGRSITITGYFHELNTIDTYILYGKVIEHEKYGQQFQTDSYERCKPEEKDAIVEFLSSGLFEGIGEKKAKTIVNLLGKDTLKIILENPSNLILIPGLSEKNINNLHNKLKEYESSYESIVYLTDLAFSMKDAMTIYNTYKKEVKNIIENDIYQLVEDIENLSFKKIDAIALKKGIDKKDIIRIKASLLYIMREISNTYGHCYYSKEELMFHLPKVIGCMVEEELFINSLKELEISYKIVIKEDKIYLKDMFDSECFIVKRFRLLNNNKTKSYKKIEEIIDNYEKFLEIEYNQNQKEAIRKSCERDFLIITGGPGTGKTTILKGILEVYRQINKYSFSTMTEKVALLSPTGRAAKRMSEATTYPASTIHRFLKWQKETNKFQVNEYNKSKVEFILLDESSMVDTYLMANLLKGISANCKIVLIGDDNQLPSVGPGQVLHDLIDSNVLEVVQLTELYRQGKDSNILTLAYDIRNQYIQKDILNKGEDLTFISCNDSEIIPNICKICNDYKLMNYHNFQILAPMYKGMNGIDRINEIVQNIFNDKSNNKREHRIGEVLFRENDKVIQLTNMPDDNVYNGDIGLIERIETSPKNEIYIDFDGNTVKYTAANFINFRQAFAISIHKSQGSEFDVVVLPMCKGYKKMLYQKLLYTAVTRTKKKLFIVGDFDALQMASSNVIEDTRRTTIKEYLVNGIK